MQIINVNDEMSDWCYTYIEEYDVFFTYYMDGYYDGSGQAIGINNDGTCHVYNLGHCSCYGPLEGTPDVTTLDELLNSEHVLSVEIEYPELKDAIVKWQKKNG